MITKHTPGPWSHEKGVICSWTKYRHAQARIGHVNSHNTTEGHDNARLIAAAPELLASLQEMLEHVEWVRRHFDFEAKYGKTGPGDCTHRARAAIAKATGGEA